MHSSIFSSETGAKALAATTASRVVVLCAIALLATIALGLELVGTLGISRVSRIQRRIDAGYQAAIRLQPAVDDKPTLLFLGNSLLLEGINFEDFQKETTAAFRSSNYYVEGTYYLDWYYAIRRLFREGSRPSIIVLGLSVIHLTNDNVRGEYFAHYLMNTSDFPSVARREKLDATAASTFFLANLSGWLGSKVEIRSWLLGRTFRNLDELGELIKPPPAIPPSAARLLQVAGPRLVELRQLCASYSTRLVLVIPPSEDVREPYLAAEQAGREAGVPVLVPYRPSEMPPQNYRDGYHLNSEGALLFTRRLEAELLNLQRKENATDTHAK